VECAGAGVGGADAVAVFIDVKVTLHIDGVKGFFQIFSRS
jgi:hypothetical protein